MRREEERIGEDRRGEGKRGEGRRGGRGGEGGIELEKVNGVTRVEHHRHPMRPHYDRQEK